MTPCACHCAACHGNACVMLRVPLLRVFDGKADIVDLILRHYHGANGWGTASLNPEDMRQIKLREQMDQTRRKIGEREIKMERAADMLEIIHLLTKSTPEHLSLPHPWQQRISSRIDVGKPYWYNPDMNESTWVCPFPNVAPSGGTPAATNAGTGQLPLKGCISRDEVTRLVQQEKNVGVNDDGFLRLRDANATYPHQSGVAWEEGMGGDKGWKAAADLKCAADPPPATLVLSGELEHQGDCLGVYVLEAGRTAHGRAVWRHEREVTDEVIILFSAVHFDVGVTLSRAQFL
eukprot:Tamp_06476.p2 GENE.Tamp_06476~~Tamp_06476.p2  ORF type:complete len:291 (+),score=69.52 Tamp_06476:628-1500(+)